MNLKVIFTIYGIYNILLGLAFIFMPGPTMGGVGIAATPDLNTTHQIWGAALIGLGWIAFKLREAESNEPLIGVARAFLVVTALAVIVTIYHITLGISGPPIYVNVIINLIAFVGIYLKAK